MAASDLIRFGSLTLRRQVVISQENSPSVWYVSQFSWQLTLARRNTQERVGFAGLSRQHNRIHVHQFRPALVTH